MGQRTRNLVFPAVMLVAALAWSQSASATEIFSPSFIADDGETAVCQILNKGSKFIAVQIQIRFNNGDVGQASGLLIILPHNLKLISLAGTNSSRVHCAFIGKFSPKNVRAAGEVEVGGQTKLVIPVQ